MYLFDNPSYLYLTLIIPIVIIINWFYMAWRNKIQKFFSNNKLLDQISPNRSNFKLNLKLVLELFIILFLSIALANPKIGTELKSINREGVDIVFAIDVSKSMLAEDVAPNRLTRSKRIISEIINSLSSDRVGIVAYAAQAIPQVPLTTDFASVKNFLQVIDTDMLSSQGTSIDSALNLSVNFFDQNSDTNRVLILISDGEDHDDIPESIINLISENNINLITIGIGQEAGTTIPIKIDGTVDSYKKDINGDVVITKRNSDFLLKIASSSKGEYIDGNFTEDALELVKTKLDKIDKSEFESSEFVEYKQQFQIFILLSLLFIISDIFIFQTKTKWIQHLNLFNENKE
ncbi:VWA domain-containing protein [Flavobacteriaceae bacterium]|jgi:Ca-activated chloride channel family protein|nr:VWA domain-containing protein [Flavobacteriaceae bacterium]MDC1010564.1 VWA domain-containing protein [Flavobacteriaceae bacterium]MDC3219265.1 VWA domain-containing protein [Flavobacteriaceae bacterium]